MTHSIRTIIVDDEPLALKFLRAKLEKISAIEIVKECKNGREAISAVADLAPDLIFLDIQMPGISGFDVIAQLQSDIMPLVVFSTAYEQYALDAFDANAIDYVLKPIDDDRINRAVERAKQRIAAFNVAKTDDSSGEAINDRKTSLVQAVENIKVARHEGKSGANGTPQEASTSASKIVVKDRDEIHILAQTEIEWIDAAGDYVCIHTKGETHVKRTTLKEILDELDDQIFKRVHRSTIVNMSFIKKVLPHTKGEFFLLLGEFDKIKVSRNYKDVVKDFLST
ncbi:MAG: two-component system LytT family response regulator [Alphaproteobacteria bacterium]|jgi:two-component system LytT family response regulator